MRLVDKQILRELIGPFLFGVAAFSSVFFAGTYLLKLTTMIMNGMPLITAAEAVLLTLPSIVVYTLPMSSLLAVLLGVSRLSGDSEMVALFAGGVSLYRVVVPIAVLGVLVSAASVALSEFVAPAAYARYEALQAKALNQISPADQPFTVRDAATNSQVIVSGGMDPASGVLKDVTVVQFAGHRPAAVIYAERAQWEGMANKEHSHRWRLYNGHWQTLGSDSPAISTFSESRTRELDLGKTPRQFALFQRSLRKKSDQMSFRELGELLSYIREYPDRPEQDIRRLEVERWNKLSLPVSSLVFALLAAPLGIRPSRSGASVGFGLSLLLILVYWMTWHYTTSLAVQGTLSPAAGAFSADAIGLAAALALLKKAAK